MEQRKLLLKLIRSGKGKSNLAFALGGMGLGVLVLLVAIQTYFDINRLLFNTIPKSGLADFLVIHKEIPSDRASHSDFTDQDIQDITQQPFVKAAGPIISNQFKVSATAGFRIQFYTDLFFEAVPDTFLDTRPANWHWTPGDPILPVIISSDFLNLYNYGFALSQGLPQLSDTTVMAIPVNLTITGTGGTVRMVANVVGFSDRISSILVPQSFMDWANQRYGITAVPPPSGLILKVNDPSDPALTSYLQAHHYQTNGEKLKYGKIRGIIATILSAIGLFGICVILLALILFSVYLQLVISRSREEIRLLSILGYEPPVLGKVLTGGMVPLYGMILLIVLLITEVLQWMGSRLLQGKGFSVSALLTPHLVWIAAGILLVFYVFTRRAVVRNIRAVS